MESWCTLEKSVWMVSSSPSASDHITCKVVKSNAALLETHIIRNKSSSTICCATCLEQVPGIPVCHMYLIFSWQVSKLTNEFESFERKDSLGLTSLCYRHCYSGHCQQIWGFWKKGFAGSVAVLHYYIYIVVAASNWKLWHRKPLNLSEFLVSPTTGRCRR